MVEILQACQTCLEAPGSIFKDLPQDDPKQRKPDITKVKASLKWEPKIGLEEGLGKVIEYFKKKLG